MVAPGRSPRSPVGQTTTTGPHHSCPISGRILDFASLTPLRSPGDRPLRPVRLRPDRRLPHPDPGTCPGAGTAYRGAGPPPPRLGGGPRHPDRDPGLGRPHIPGGDRSVDGLSPGLRRAALGRRRLPAVDGRPAALVDAAPRRRDGGRRRGPATLPPPGHAVR